MTTGGRFDHYLAELGIEARTARWESPFDFPRQALLYLPQAMPVARRQRAFPERVAEAAWPLLRANGGRAFLLCTTLRAVDRVAARLQQLMERDATSLPLLVQGSSSRRTMLDGFRASGNAVLVGSASFWEGIDIRGDALSLVVIDKLPFAPPDDPIVEAKIRYLRRSGRNPFNDYQLPEAVLRLQQGAGRLIRDENDRGVLMMLDERVLTKSYGRTVLASLPPFARTRSEAEAIEFPDAPRWRQLAAALLPAAQVAAVGEIERDDTLGVGLQVGHLERLVRARHQDRAHLPTAASVWKSRTTTCARWIAATYARGHSRSSRRRVLPAPSRSAGSACAPARRRRTCCPDSA